MLTECAVRQATPADCEWVCSLVEAREHPDHPLTGVSGRRQCHWTAQQYRFNWSSLLARPEIVMLTCRQSASYVVAILGDRESLTSDRQVLISDWVGDLGLFLEALLERARGDRASYLVTRTLPEQPHNLEALGFQPEITRLMARLEGRPNTSSFRVRRAAAKDRFFIANLHRQGGHFYVPANRPVDVAEMSFRNLTHYMGMDLGPQSQMTGYVICDDQGRPLGYVLFKLGLRLEVTGAPLVYLYDINLHQDHWGRSAARILLRQAMLELQQQGLEFMVGDVSCGNATVHQLALRAANFRHEWTRWGRKV